MILSSMELLYLAAYWILVYEYVVMRHMAICTESDARINSQFECGAGHRAVFLYWNRGTK